MLLSCKDDLLVTPDDSSAMFCRLGRYAVESYLEQILSHGFFHADPVSSCFCFDFWCYTKWLKYTYNWPTMIIFWKSKMIPEQNLLCLHTCRNALHLYLHVFVLKISNAYV
jgi:hypothetical protein